MQTAEFFFDPVREDYECRPRQRRTAALRWSSLIVLTAAIGGCSKSDGLVSVRGAVTLDGKPLSQAQILFRKVDGDQRAFGAPIENGEYSFRTEVGPMTVQITAWRPTGKIVREGETEIALGEQYLPTRYNVESKLTAEVATSANDIPFHLTSE